MTLVHKVMSTAASCLLYITLGLQLYVAVGDFGDLRWPNAITSTVLLAAAIVAVNAISAFLILRTSHTDHPTHEKTIAILSHVLQVGLMYRCVRMYGNSSRDEVREFCLLALGQVFVSCLPVAIMESHILLSHDKFNIAVIVFVVLTLVLSSCVLLHAHMILVESLETASPKAVCYRNNVVTVANLLSVALLVLSRALSIVLFFEVHGYWLFLLISVHFVAIFSVLFIKSTRSTCCDRKTLSLNLCRCASTSYVNVIESFDLTTKRSNCAQVLFYAVILVENAAMSATWLMHTDDSTDLKLAMVMIVLSSYVFGLVCKYSHSCWESEDSNDLIKALGITKKYDPGDTFDDTLNVKKKINGAFSSPNGSYMIKECDERGSTYMAFNNPAFETPENNLDEADAEMTHDAIKPECKTTLKHKKSDQSKTRSPVKISKNKIKLFFHDTGSNTSRNTNTLPGSSGEEPYRCKTCCKFIPGEYPMCHGSGNKNAGNYTANVYDQSDSLRAGMVLNAVNLRSKSPKTVERGERFTLSETSLESDTIEDSSLMNSYHFYMHQGGQDRASPTDTITDTFSELTYTNYSTSSDSDLIRGSRTRRENKCPLPAEKLSTDERISAWFTHSNQYFKSEDSIQNDKHIENHVKLKENQCDHRDIQQEINYSQSDNASKNSNSNNNNNYVVFDHVCHDKTGGVCAQDITNRASPVSSNRSSTTASDSKHCTKRKIPYRDALEEYYRKSTLPYHISYTRAARNGRGFNNTAMGTDMGRYSRENWDRATLPVKPSYDRTAGKREGESVV